MRYWEAVDFRNMSNMLVKNIPKCWYGYIDYKVNNRQGGVRLFSNLPQ